MNWKRVEYMNALYISKLVCEGIYHDIASHRLNAKLHLHLSDLTEYPRHILEIPFMTSRY